MTERKSWWTPTGWERGPEPEAFSSIQVFSEEAWNGAGYYDRAIFGHEDSCWSYIVEIRDHSDGHLVVILDIPFDRWLTCFFVSAMFASAFYVDKLPSLLAAAAAVDQAEATKALHKAVVAFIRHGSGRETIDSDGLVTLDDRWRDAEEQERRRRQKGDAP